MPRSAAQPETAAATRLERAGTLAARAGSLQPADPALRRGLHIGIALLLLLGVGLAISAALDRLPEIEWRFNPAALTIGIALLVAYSLLNAELWRRILHSLGPELPPLQSAAIWFTSGLGRYVPTSLLLPVVRSAMAERLGAPKRICLASVVYEYSLSFTAALIVGAYSLIELPELQGHWQRFLVLVLPLAGLIVLHPRVFHRVSDAALMRLGRDRLPAALQVRTLLGFLAGYGVVYLLAGASVYALAQLVYPVGRDELATVIGAFAGATALGIIAFVLPAGLIAREAGLAVALTPVMPAAPAVALAVVVRMVQIGTELVLTVLLQALARTRPTGQMSPTSSQ